MIVGVGQTADSEVANAMENSGDTRGRVRTQMRRLKVEEIASFV